MSPYMFGVSRERITYAERRKLERIAAKHGAELIEATVPGTGYLRWFETYKVPPFAQDTERRVMAELSLRIREAS